MKENLLFPTKDKQYNVLNLVESEGKINDDCPDEEEKFPVIDDIITKTSGNIDSLKDKVKRNNADSFGEPAPKSGILSVNSPEENTDSSTTESKITKKVPSPRELIRKMERESRMAVNLKPKNKEFYLSLFPSEFREKFNPEFVDIKMNPSLWKKEFFELTNSVKYMGKEKEGTMSSQGFIINIPKNIVEAEELIKSSFCINALVVNDNGVRKIAGLLDCHAIDNGFSREWYNDVFLKNLMLFKDLEDEEAAITNPDMSRLVMANQIITHKDFRRMGIGFILQKYVVEQVLKNYGCKAFVAEMLVSPTQNAASIALNMEAIGKKMIGHRIERKIFNDQNLSLFWMVNFINPQTFIFNKK